MVGVVQKYIGFVLFLFQLSDSIYIYLFPNVFFILLLCTSKCDIVVMCSVGSGLSLKTHSLNVQINIPSKGYSLF